MACQRCKSARVAKMSAKCSDLFYASISIGEPGTPEHEVKEHDGYVPDDMGIGESDYVCFEWCLACGQIQGACWPVPPTKLEGADGEA